MAIIPRSRVRTQPSGSVATPTPRRGIAQQAGAGLQSFGQGLSQFGRHLEAYEREKKRTQERINAQKASTAAERAAIEAENDAYEAGRNGADVGEAYNKFLNEYKSEYLKNVSDKKTKQQADAFFEQARNKRLDNVLKRGRALEVERIQTDVTAIINENTALANQDPTNINTYDRNAVDAIVALKLPASERDKAIKALRREMVLSSMDGYLSQKSPAGYAGAKHMLGQGAEFFSQKERRQLDERIANKMLSDMRLAQEMENIHESKERRRVKALKESNFERLQQEFNEISEADAIPQNILDQKINEVETLISLNRLGKAEGNFLLKQMKQVDDFEDADAEFVIQDLISKGRLDEAYSQVHQFVEADTLHSKTGTRLLNRIKSARKSGGSSRKQAQSRKLGDALIKDVIRTKTPIGNFDIPGARIKQISVMRLAEELSESEGIPYFEAAEQALKLSGEGAQDFAFIRDQDGLKKAVEAVHSDYKSGSIGKREYFNRIRQLNIKKLELEALDTKSKLELGDFSNVGE